MLRTGLLAAALLVAAALSPRVSAASPHSVTLTLAPGLHPAGPQLGGLRVAPNAPRGPFTISLPLYPGATPLAHDIASPFFDYPLDPYLQTASAEYHTPDSLGQVRSWVRRTFSASGWHGEGSFNGNASAFTSGISFIANSNPDLTVAVSFGEDASGGTYLGYGVEEIILPPRPPRSYLHGPFVQLRLAQSIYLHEQTKVEVRTIHTTVQARPIIRRLVQAINGIRGYRTVLGLCAGGGPGQGGPIWLTFVRANGSMVHAYESGPGACGGLAVDGVRWLTDRGAIWDLLHSLIGGRG